MAAIVVAIVVVVVVVVVFVVVTGLGLTGLMCGVVGAGVVTTRLTGPERTVYVLVNTLPIRTLRSLERVHRSGHLSEGRVAMHRLSVHWIYICKYRHLHLTVRTNNANIL